MSLKLLLTYCIRPLLAEAGVVRPPTVAEVFDIAVATSEQLGIDDTC